MTKISLLDKNTINQIAAGEVVERPSSVVKELIENAIDAGATAITVEIKEGGLSFIRITDNGSGIEKEDIAVAFLRHSTSKITCVEDLLTVGSLGFRGEALSSIASVAKVELITKTRTALIGSRYLIEGGEEKGLSSIGCPEGSTFLIRNLFYNTPARRKFLKSAMTESGYVGDLVERLALSHKEISFKFINNNKTLLHTSGNGNLKDIIYHVFGREIAAGLLFVHEVADNILIDGFIGKPIISRGNRNFENYFINGRFIKSTIISKAIEEAYKPFSMQHKYPFTVLHFQIDPGLIDVNVHPSKMEIRFLNGELLFQMVLYTLRNVLSGTNMIPDVKLTKETKPAKTWANVPEPFEKNRLSRPESKDLNVFQNNDQTLKRPITSRDEVRAYMEQKREREINEMNRSEFLKPTIGLKDTPYFVEKKENQKDTEPANENSSQKEIEPAKEYYNQNELFDYENTLSNECVKEDTFFNQINVKKYRLIGQLFSTYWLVEYDGQLLLIDQHAAHEKVLYEKTLAKMKKKEFLSQMISPPIVLTLSLREEEAVKRYKDTLKELGFTIEAFGGREYVVRSLPADMLSIEGKDLLIEFIDDLVQEAPTKSSNLMIEKVASMSCKAAVKGNHSMSIVEAEALINQLMTLENPFHCPHGRPIMISMSKHEIEKKFMR